MKSKPEINRYFTNSPWEKTVSYCRAIRNGNWIAVSGTTATVEGKTFAPQDPYQQTHKCLEIIEKALDELGAKRSNIVRTRMFVTDISKWELYGKAHGEFFRECPPATAMYEVKNLISPDLLIEIEADAIL